MFNNNSSSNNNNNNKQYTYIGNKDEKDHRSWAVLTITFLLITLSVAFYGTTMNGGSRLIANNTNTAPITNLLRSHDHDDDDEDDDKGGLFITSLLRSHDHDDDDDDGKGGEDDDDDDVDDDDEEETNKTPTTLGDDSGNAGLGERCGWLPIAGEWIPYFVACGSNLSCISRGICAANAKPGEPCGTAAGGVDCLGFDSFCSHERCT